MLTVEEIGKLTVVKYPDPVLAREAQPIEHLETWVETLARKMLELMHAHRGVGLAGNQVGLPLRIFTYSPTAEQGDDHVLINPQLIDEIGWAEHEEGCLSLPEIYGKVRRRKRVIVEGLELDGSRVKLDAQEILARIMQHELDHLNGRLIVERMTPLARLAARRQLKTLEEQAKNG